MANSRLLFNKEPGPPSYPATSPVSELCVELLPQLEELINAPTLGTVRILVLEYIKDSDYRVWWESPTSN